MELSALSAAIGLGVLGWLGYRQLRREDLAQFDLPLGRLIQTDDPEFQRRSQVAMEDIVQRLKSSPARSSKLSIKQRVPIMREAMEDFFGAAEALCVSEFKTVDAGGVPAEWVVAPGVDRENNRRLLYIHGGAFFAGSPKSHRVMTSKLSELTGCAVLSIDYRLTPEHSRRDSADDCRSCYDWMLNNGPKGEQPAEVVLVAGDSAGGNLTLMLLAWLRDTSRRQPNAAVAFSPVTDCRYSSPSITSNLESDLMLKPLAGQMAKLPKFLIPLSARLIARDNTSDPVLSPLLGDLANLPPTLIMASDTEILRDDGRRYVNKAVAAGSTAEFLYWKDMPHVWPIFYPQLPEADQAFEQVQEFVGRCC
jgi:acetyl esterase/lipase